MKNWKLDFEPHVFLKATTSKFKKLPCSLDRFGCQDSVSTHFANIPECPKRLSYNWCVFIYIHIRYLTSTPPHQTHKKSLEKKGWDLYQELCLPRYSSHSYYQFFVGPCYHLGYRSQKPLWGVSWDSISHHQQQGGFWGNGVGGFFVVPCHWKPPFLPRKVECAWECLGYFWTTGMVELKGPHPLNATLRK